MINVSALPCSGLGRLYFVMLAKERELSTQIYPDSFRWLGSPKAAFKMPAVRSTHAAADANSVAFESVLDRVRVPKGAEKMYRRVQDVITAKT